MYDHFGKDIPLFIQYLQIKPLRNKVKYFWISSPRKNKWGWGFKIGKDTKM